MTDGCGGEKNGISHDSSKFPKRRRSTSVSESFPFPEAALRKQIQTSHSKHAADPPISFPKRPLVVQFGTSSVHSGSVHLDEARNPQELILIYVSSVESFRTSNRLGEVVYLPSVVANVSVVFHRFLLGVACSL